MHVERLQRLAALLRKDADDPKGVKFDLGVWAAPSEDYQKSRGGHYFPHNAVEKIEVSCGTTACALGLAAISGEFKADGLTAYFAPGFECGGTTKYSLWPQYEGYDGMSAGQRFFGLETIGQSRFLFDPECYDELPVGREGELFVADRIDGLIASGGETPGFDDDGDRFGEDDDYSDED